MSGDLGGIGRGTPIQETPPDLLEAPHDGVEIGGIIQDSIQGRTRGDTGNPLSPTILNLVVDAVVCHWVTVLIVGAEERGMLGKEGRH